MKTTYVRKALALVSLAAIAACGGGGGGSGSFVPAHGAGGGTTGGSALLSRIVGVGDSLTAGFQAGGILGQTGVPDPLFSGLTIAPTQEQGFWADVYEQASGTSIPAAIASMYDPSISPLPLIAGPGLNNQIVPSLPPAPFGLEKPGNACADDDGFNDAGYRLNPSARTRMNPVSTTIRNVAVPGITLHEANTLTRPQSTSCKPLTGIRGLLAMVVDGESSTYWPILRNWSFMGQQLTMVNAAAQLKPTLAIVWLGANDVLKYMGSGGQFHGGDDTVAQASGDLRQTIGTLTHAGAHVVVANLPNILETPYFMRVTVPPYGSRECTIQTYLVCFLANFYGYETSTKLTNQIAAQYHLATPNGCTPTSTSSPCGYMTLQGTLAVLDYYNEHGKLPNLDGNKPGSGLGTYYITPQFAAAVQARNDTINAGIDQAVAKTASPLVDVHAIFAGIASGNRSNPYYQLATSIKGSVFCCTLAYENGLVSFDGLHPSNTGYALLAHYFIAAINSSYGAKIPQIDLEGAYKGTRCSNRSFCFPDPYAPPCAQNPAGCITSSFARPAWRPSTQGTLSNFGSL